MKRLVTVMILLGVACGTLAGIGIPQAAAQAATCEKFEKAKTAITTAENMQAIDDAMVAADFPPLGVEKMESIFDSLDEAKGMALQILEASVNGVCQEATTPL